MVAAKLLNYELSPSPATVFGCLLPAPWLGACSGLLLAFGSAQGLPDRFAPLTLALVHSLVLGMLAPVMIGALFQLMPVVAGQSVPGAKRIAPLVALTSALIALGLGLGFLYGEPRGFMLAAVLAALLFGTVAVQLMIAGARVVVVDCSTRTLRWAGGALLIVVSLGIALAGSLAGLWHPDILPLLNAHVSWGLLGWTCCLLLGVASTTVPMFWQTVRPQGWWQRFLPVPFFVILLAAMLPAFWSGALLLGCLLLAVVAARALYAIVRAKRRFDPAWPLWLCSSACWLTAALLMAWLNLSSHWNLYVYLQPPLPWLIGVLALVGGAVMPVNAMLGKIIPFLVFLHLRRQTPVGRRVPTMQDVLAPAYLRWQARLLMLALLLLLLLPLAPQEMAMPAGLVFAASQAALAALLMRALLRYRKELRSVFLAS